MTDDGRRRALALARAIAALALVALFFYSVFKLTESERMWRYFERTHHCRVIDVRGQWATYFCEDGLTFSRRR